MCCWLRRQRHLREELGSSRSRSPNHGGRSQLHHLRSGHGRRLSRLRGGRRQHFLDPQTHRRCGSVSPMKVPDGPHWRTNRRVRQVRAAVREVNSVSAVRQGDLPRLLRYVLSLIGWTCALKSDTFMWSLRCGARDLRAQMPSDVSRCGNYWLCCEGAPPPPPPIDHPQVHNRGQRRPLY